MATDLNTPVNDSDNKEKAKSKLIVRLTIPLLLLVVFQVVFFCVVMIAGGEFSYVRQYAYSTLVEQTENRRNYLRNEFQHRMPFVQETAGKINAHVAEVLEGQQASIEDLQTKRELSELIMAASMENLTDLMWRSRVSDVYLILETGELCGADSGSGNAKAALYLWDPDTTRDEWYEDLLMEMGPASLSQETGIALGSGWTLCFEPDPEDIKTFDFYYTTLQTAQENNTLMMTSLDYWSGFSRLSENIPASMKYSVPLMTEDGTVYGIIGIGLTEDVILGNLPADDFMYKTGCYVFGHSRIDDQFEIISYSGEEFDRLVGNTEFLQVSGTLGDNVYDFSLDSGIPVAGSIHYMNLYNQRNPHHGEHWALISIADRASVLSPLTATVRMIVISTMFTLAVSSIVVIIICSKVVRPITDAIETMDSKREYNRIIRFQPSGIYELDMMTDAITRLQINAQEFSSQVSKMIRIADVGLGVFMYDRTDDSVFVGQSFSKLLQTRMQRDEDIVMSRQEFLDNIAAEETRQVVAEGLGIMSGRQPEDYIKEYSTVQEDGRTIWLRLNFVYNADKSIGILQDITGEMIEKKRIEYERDYDSLTGLLNRNAYARFIEDLFRNTYELKIAAFVMIDLDNLKYVNDTYGHDFGDDYIKAAATALKKFLDYGGIVARLSGDEFNVFLPRFSSKEEIREIIGEVYQEISQSYSLLSDGRHFKIRASAGVSWYPDDATAYEILMKYADFAMYTVKHSTKGRVAEFDMNAYSMNSVLLTGVEEMNRIIDESSVRYAFQGIVSARTGEIYGYEALMRPQSTVFQSPLELIRTAKAGAKLYAIERLTCMKALDEFKKQIDAGNIAKDSHIFINSIAGNVLDQSDIDVIQEAYADLVSRIVLEVLEAEKASEENLASKMEQVKKWNGNIAMGNFGMGYNSEYALITMKPDIIKIDRSIISGCDKDASRSTIISNLVRLAQAKQILVVAEGVETEAELKTVISCGVDLLQGYYFNRPVFEPQPLAPEIIEQIKRYRKKSCNRQEEDIQ